MLFTFRKDVPGKRAARVRSSFALIIATTFIAASSGMTRNPDQEGPVVGIAQLPASVGAVLVVEEAAALRTSDAGRAAVHAIAKTGLLTKTTKSWEELARSLSWTPDEAFDELFGRRVVLAFDDLSSKGETRWVVIADVNQSAQTRLRKKLKLAPRTIENNTRVLAGERGRFRLAIIPGPDGSRLSSLLIAPVDHKALFFDILHALTAPDTDLPRLRDTEAYRQLQKLERRPLRLLVRKPQDNENKTSFFTLAAKRVESDWIAHWTGSFDLLGISHDIADNAHAWPWPAFELIAKDAMVAVMGVTGRVQTEGLGSLSRVASGLLNIGGVASALENTGPVQLFAIRRRVLPSATDADALLKPSVDLTIAAQGTEAASAQAIDRSLAKFIAAAAQSPSRTSLDMKGAFPTAIRSVEFESCDQSELQWFFPGGDDLTISWTHAKGPPRDSSEAWWVVQIANEQAAASSSERMLTVCDVLQTEKKGQSSTDWISMGVVNPRELIGWLTELGMESTGELAIFQDIERIRWDAWITSNQIAEGEARISVRPSDGIAP